MDITTKTYTFLHAPLPCFESVLNVHCREEHGVGRRTRMSRHETHSRILKLNAGIFVFVPEKMENTLCALYHSAVFMQKRKFLIDFFDVLPNGRQGPVPLPIELANVSL